jgi:hypothetical protein
MCGNLEVGVFRQAYAYQEASSLVLAFPALARLGHVGPTLLGGVQRFF